MSTTSTTTANTTVSYKVDSRIGPIYTGGRVEIVKRLDSDDVAIILRAGGKFTLCDRFGMQISCLDLEQSDTSITSFTMKDSQTLVSCTSDNLLEVWSMDMTSNFPIRSWKAHASPILVMAHHAVHPLLATGSADHGVRVWDSDKNYCTHNLKGVHGAIITALAFHPNSNIMQLVSGAEDGSVALWDLIESRAVRSMKGAHMSAVSVVEISPDGRHLASAGRDQVVNIWNLQSATSKPFKTLAVIEAVESIGFLPDGEHFFTVGEKGSLRIWSINEEKSILSSDKLTSEGHVISQALLVGEEILAITSDLNLIFLNFNNLTLSRTIVGHHGEVTDLALLDLASGSIAIATNGPEIRVTTKDSGRNCSFLKGHSEAVISLAANSKYLLSGSRDHEAILWRLHGASLPEKIVTLTGHTDAVSAVALSHGKKSSEYAATGSTDMTLKMWHLQGDEDKVTSTLKWTIKAHEKDINSIVFSPNEKYLISCSQDKTAKVWRVEDGSLLGTLKGHKRGVWNAAVSPIEQVVATASSDRTIKLWSLSSEYNCLKTLEGHNNSILRVQFIRRGTQLVSASSDGIVKIWHVKKGECLATFDEHSDRIWALLIEDDGELLLTGDAAGVINTWKDFTLEEREQMQVLRDETILKEQQLSNFIIKKDFANAVQLALQLQQPHRLHSLLSNLLDGKAIKDSLALLENLFSNMTEEEYARILTWLREWNVSLKRCYVSQLVLHVLLKKGHIHHKNVNSESPSNATSPNPTEVLSHVLAYTERHMEKVDDLLINSHLIDFVVDKIK